MSHIIKRLEWLEGYDNVLIERRDVDDHILFDLYLEDGELLTKPTQPLWTDKRFPELQPGCVWIKNYSEHQGLGAALTEAGVVVPTGRTVAFGPYDASSSEYLLTTEFGGDDDIEHVVVRIVDLGRVATEESLEVVTIQEAIQRILKVMQTEGDPLTEGELSLIQDAAVERLMEE